MERVRDEGGRGRRGNWNCVKLGGESGMVKKGKLGRIVRRWGEGREVGAVVAA